MLAPPPERATAIVEPAELTEREGRDLISLRNHPYRTSRLDVLAVSRKRGSSPGPDVQGPPKVQVGQLALGQAISTFVLEQVESADIS